MAANGNKAAKAGNGEDDLKLLYLVSYLVLWLSGIAVYLIYGSRGKRIRFHSVQAVLYGILITVLQAIFAVLSPFVGMLSILFSLLLIILWLYGLYVGYRAMEGEDIKITTIGDLAQRYS